jgi:cation transport ATPase
MPDVKPSATAAIRAEIHGHVHGHDHHEGEHHDHGGHDDHDHDREGHDHDHSEGWLDWGRVAFVAAVLLVVWLRVFPTFRGMDFVALTGILIGGYPIFKEAISDLLQRRMTMELSMTIALVAASVIGEFFTALLITVFVLIAEILEGMTVGRGGAQSANFWISYR